MNATELAQHIHAEEQFGVQLMDYAGEWVAVRDHQVIKHAATLDGLFELIGAHAADIKVVRVPRHPEAACFF